MRVSNKILAIGALLSGQAIYVAPNVLDILDVVMMAKSSTTSQPAAKTPAGQATAVATSLESVKKLSMAQLQALFVAAGITPSVVTASFTKAQTASGHSYPSGFNINWGSRQNTKVGFAFVSSPAAWGPSSSVAADITSLLLNRNWSKGVSFTLLPFDANNNLIMNVETTAPTSFYILVFNSEGSLLGLAPCPLSSAITVAPYVNPAAPWTNTMEAGLAGGPIGVTPTNIYGTSASSYPMILTLTSSPVAPAGQATAVATSLESVKKLSMAQLQALFVAAGITPSVVTASFTKAQTASGYSYPSGFNINWGSRQNTKVGFAFVSSPAAWGSSSSVAADITSLLLNRNWSKGVSFTLLPFDANNNLIMNVETTAPTSFYILVFNSEGRLLGLAPCPLSSAITVAPYVNPAAPWTNTMEAGLAGGPIGVTPTNIYGTSASSYPMILTLTSSPILPTDFAALGNISQFKQFLPTLATSVISLTISSLPANNCPAFFNINIGQQIGFPFNSNPWTNSTTNIAGDITSFFAPNQNVDWSKGVVFVPLAFDANNHYIASMATTTPISFALYVFDATGNNLGYLPFPITSGYQGSPDFNPVAAGASWPNTIVAGVSAGAFVGSANYPAMVSVTYAAPAQQANASSAPTQQTNTSSNWEEGEI